MKRGRPDEAKIFLMREEIKKQMIDGKLQRSWLKHPVPNMAEPDKKIFYLTIGPEQYDLDHLSALFYRASLHAMDRFFMQMRRRVNIFERPIATPSSQNRRWHGYAPYDPKMIVWLAEIYRVFYNYVYKGKKGETPAMRLGLAEGVMEMGDILNFSGGIARGGYNGTQRYHRCYIPKPRRKKGGKSEKPTPLLDTLSEEEVTIIPELIGKLDFPPSPRIYLDVEVADDMGGIDGMIWLIGVYDEARKKFRQFLDKTGEEEESLLLAFLKYCKKIPEGTTIVSYGDFDKRALTTRLGVCKLEIPRVITSMIDLYPSIRSSIKLPVYETYGLKNVAGRLKYKFRYTGLDGATVAGEYMDCVNEHKKMPRKFLRYNKDDVFALRHIVRWAVKESENNSEKI